MLKIKGREGRQGTESWTCCLDKGKYIFSHQGDARPEEPPLFPRGECGKLPRRAWHETDDRVDRSPLVRMLPLVLRQGDERTGFFLCVQSARTRLIKSVTKERASAWLPTSPREISGVRLVECDHGERKYFQTILPSTVDHDLGRFVEGWRKVPLQPLTWRDMVPQTTKKGCA